MMKRRDQHPDPLTRDFFFKKKVTVYQYRRGYRFSVDAPVLAAFLPACSGPVLEVGCGSGVVSLLALYLDRFPAVTGIEIQLRLAGLAGRNARENGLYAKLSIVCGDFCKIYKNFAGTGLIFSNPPFIKTGRGKLSREKEIRLAKFEVSLTLADVIEKSAAILVPGGRLCLVFPAQRHEEAQALAGRAGLQLSRLRRIQPFADAEPDRVLGEWRRGKTNSTELPPLVIFRDRGVYTEEMEAILSGNLQ